MTALKPDERERLLELLRVERDRAAARGDHAEALILNDRIADLKDASSPTVERVMRQFESALARRKAYGPPSAH
jgi:hypothetical protein